jgi:hypothetical protein
MLASRSFMAPMARKLREAVPTEEEEDKASGHSRGSLTVRVAGFNRTSKATRREKGSTASVF